MKYLDFKIPVESEEDLLERVLVAAVIIHQDSWGVYKNMLRSTLCANNSRVAT